MKIIGVRNYKTADTIRYVMSLSFNEATQDLTINAVTTDLLIEDTEAERYRIETSAVANLNELRARRDWCDHQVYFVAMEERKFIPLIGLYEETLERREVAADYAKRLKRSLIVGINVPFAGATNDELFITVNMNPNAADADLTVGPGLEKIWSEASSSGTERTLRLPTIVAVAPPSMAPDSTVPVTVRLEDAQGNLIQKNATVYVETVSGFAGGTRVAITNGVGVLPVSSAGMLAGGTIRVKLGWKFYVGVEDVVIQVV